MKKVQNYSPCINKKGKNYEIFWVGFLRLIARFQQQTFTGPWAPIPIIKLFLVHLVRKQISHVRTGLMVHTTLRSGRVRTPYLPEKFQENQSIIYALLYVGHFRLCVYLRKLVQSN